MDESRKEKEQAFHDRVFQDETSEREEVNKYYAIHRDTRLRYEEIVTGLCDGRRLLEYGCGTGSHSEQWLKQGAVLTGIDISPEGVKKARERIAETVYEAEYHVMDAEATEFADGSFDLVVGTSILHHLDLKTCYGELARILASDGHAVFIEPLGHNPVINLYRALTPRMRTEDEHPLRLRDITLLKDYFSTLQIEYFSLFALLAVPFRNMSIFESVYSGLKSIDRLFFRLPFMRRYAWTVIIHVSNPR